MFIRIFQAIDALMFYILVPAITLIFLYMGGSWLINPPPEEYGFVAVLDSPDIRKMMLLWGVLMVLAWCVMAVLRKRRKAMMKELNELRKNNGNRR